MKIIHSSIAINFIPYQQRDDNMSNTLEDKIKILVFGKIRKAGKFDQYLSIGIDKIWKLNRCVVLIDKTLLSETCADNQIKVSLSDKFFNNNKPRCSSAYLSLLTSVKEAGQDINEDESVHELCIDFDKLSDDFGTCFWKTFLKQYKFPLTLGPNGDDHGQKYYYFEFGIEIYNIKKSSVSIDLDLDNRDYGPPRKKVKLENDCDDNKDNKVKKRFEGIKYPSYNLTIDVRGQQSSQERRFITGKVTLRRHKLSEMQKNNIINFQRQQAKII